MKKFSLFLAAFGFAAFASAQAVAVTFSVDVSKEALAGRNVYIAGNFKDVDYDGVVFENPTLVNWDEDSLKLTNVSGGVYSITMNLVPATYNYKFTIAGNGGSSSWENDPNREYIVSGTTALTVPTYCFNEKATAGPCPAGPVDTLNVTLKVNMNNFITMFGATAFDMVSIAGNFGGKAGQANDTTWTDWSPGQIELTDADADKVYETTFRLPEGTYAYKFLAGDAWEKTSCSSVVTAI